MTTPVTPDSARVLRTVTAFAEAHQSAPGLVVKGQEGLATALADELLVVPDDGAVGEVDLARAAVDLLATDERYRAEVQALLGGPAPERFAVVETTVLITAALVALQTHVRITRNTSGKWAIHVEKKPTDVAILKKLVAKLLPFI